MLFDEMDKEKLKYYFSKFGNGEFLGPHYILKKSKNKIKIKGNNESVYDLPYYFIMSSENNKIKGKIYVPKDLDFETNIEIKKENKKQKYIELTLEGKGYFKANYFFFIGDIENEHGKIKTKKPKTIDENDKNYFSFLKGELLENLNFFDDFKKELIYKVSLNIKVKLNKEEKKVIPVREIKIKKEIIKDNQKSEEEKEIIVEEK
ncbi:MAG: hypothetical protein ABGW69_02800 [Nanoarchaeota archaeon]